MKLDTLIEAAKVAIEHMADKIAINGIFFATAFGFVLYGLLYQSGLALCISAAVGAFFIINLVFTYRKSVIDWYVRAENKQYIKKNGHKIIEERTKEAKMILDKMYANYPNAILLEPSSPPVQELQRFEIIYPALGVSIYDGSVPRQYFYLHIWAKEIVNESRKQKRNTKTKLQHLSKQE